MDINNRFTDDETLEHAYDIFLSLAADNLTPADIILFNEEFQKRGTTELLSPSNDWQKYLDSDIELNPDFFAEVIIGLIAEETGIITDNFARMLICREKNHKLCHVLWKNKR